ncbi:COG3014 family protein [Marinobacter sp. 2_MG-2023]|uniref:COG3014 family protein n=1 Tax=Marinobacter sp. 2_MG-2023 TaxID=3062679 RepID=UPI0026E44138|nr:hypothetical protein [Marinobacter sp. 2_MG-2023]MDO6442958.1 hypothetical protein [Marinobacter sp. 2_MG-2023]
MKSSWYVVFAAILALLVSGCSSFHQRDQLASFNSAYVAGDYTSALKAMSFRESDKKPVDSRAHLLELLHQGEMYRLTGHYDESVKAFDLAEEGMKYLDTEGLLASATEGLLAVMVNDSTRDYEALMSEAVLVNTYKGLAFLASGNTEYARVEFNRADDRTRRAVDYFRKEIAEQQAALKREAQSGNQKASMVRTSLGDSRFQSAVDNQYGATSSWSVFPEFIVPSSTYLHGIYFLANAEDAADYERAVTSLGRVAQMSPGSRVLQADAELAADLASGRQSLKELPPQVWVLYENGLGPVLRESRLDVPLFIVRGAHQAPAYVGIALPEYTERSAVPGGLGVVEPTGQLVQTERISDMGKVIRTEMKERFPGILSRAVASAISKAVLQSEAADQFGPWGQLFAAAYAVATTQADLRSWQALPDHWEALRVDRPESGSITLLDNRGKVLGELDIPHQAFTLVYVKRPTLSAPATVITMDLQGKTEATLRRMPE